MKLIIAVSKSINSMFLMNEIMNMTWKYMAIDIFDIEKILLNNENEIDNLGKKWAERNNIDIEIYKIKQNKYKKIVKNADALVFIWDGKSKHTHRLIQWSLLNYLLVFGLIWKGGILHTDYKINTYETNKSYFKFLTKKE